MQRNKLAQRMKVITIVLTAVLALATFTVLSVVRTRLLAEETSIKKAGSDYSGLKKVYSQVSQENVEPQATPVSISDTNP